MFVLNIAKIPGSKSPDVIIRMAATCVCGSDLWPYQGIQKVSEPTPMGHEYCGIVEEVGSAFKTVKPGQFVIGSFCISDHTCPNCQARIPVRAAPSDTSEFLME